MIALIVCAAAVAGLALGYGARGDTTAHHIVFGCGIGLAAVLAAVAWVCRPRRTR